jgi:hypothetical protein
MISDIDSKASYGEVMQEIDYLMNKGSENVSAEELNEIKNLSFAAQQYEKKNCVATDTIIITNL